jgi:hypothetical protein
LLGIAPISSSAGAAEIVANENEASIEYTLDVTEPDLICHEVCDTDGVSAVQRASRGEWGGG